MRLLINLQRSNCTTALLVLLGLSACQKSIQTSGERTYRMGFQNSTPRLDANLDIQSLNMWTARADAAIISGELPWDSLLGGENPVNYVVNNYLALSNFYRSKNLKLWVYVDPENGLNRTSDADALVAAGKSIAEPGMQVLYRRFCVVMDSILKPDHLGLALETNLIRGAAPDSVYQGVKQAANLAAMDIRAIDKNTPIGVSVQVDFAWGKLGNNIYSGVSQDFVDFPFIQELGLSSYPYFGFSSPSAIPSNYYSRLTAGKTLAVFLSEGGWTSQGISDFLGRAIASSPLVQQQYIDRQDQLLRAAGAIGWFQLTFTDIDLSGLPPALATSLQFFAYLGLVDSNLQAKPALSSWDSLYKKMLKPGN
jgi:hypothetical protein